MRIFLFSAHFLANHLILIVHVGNFQVIRTVLNDTKFWWGECVTLYSFYLVD